MVTMSDVARHAGVSSATVSRVLNRSAVVDERTRMMVENAVAALKYRPNTVAQGLASRSSRTVGVVINRFNSVYYGAMLDGAEKALDDLGYKTIVESSRELAEGEREAWLSLLDRQCEAVIIHSDNLEDGELSEWMERHPKSVLMNRKLAGFEGRCVHLDNRRGGALAAQHLLQKGHRHIAMVSGPNEFYEVRDRSEGFESALREAGLTLDPDLIIEGNFLDHGGQAAMNQLLDGDKSFTAVFFHNDEMVAGALDVCRVRGVHVPEDLSIIGFDDLSLARHLTPSLTTIRQPLHEIGAAAGRLAQALATGSEDAGQIQTIFEAEVVERASVSHPKRSTPGRNP